MAAKVETWGNGTSKRSITFTLMSKEELQDQCRIMFGSIPFNARSGVPSPICYQVLEVFE